MPSAIGNPMLDHSEYAPFDSFFRSGGQRHDASVGVADAVLAEPRKRAGGVGHRLDGRERLARHCDHRRGWIASREGLFERQSVDVRHDMDVDHRAVPPQRVDRQLGA